MPFIKIPVTEEQHKRITRAAAIQRPKASVASCGAHVMDQWALEVIEDDYIKRELKKKQVNK
jgi:hypothetical protein